MCASECGSPFFWLPAARVRVPGGSPFGQLQQHDKDNPSFVRNYKNVYDHWSKQWNELNEQIQKYITSADECVRDERSIPEFASSMVHTKEDRRREAIRFEIPVTRGAFDQEKGSTDDIKYRLTRKNSGHNVL